MSAHPSATPDEPGDRQPQSPLGAVTALSRPVVGFVWTEKRGIALTALLYVLGLVVWSLNASRRDLGLGAAADLQYLVAGLVPALVLAVALVVLAAWLRLPAWTRHWLRTSRPALADLLAAVGSLLFALGVVGLAVLGWAGLLDRFPVLAAIVWSSFGAGVLVSGLVREATWLFRLVWFVYAPVAIVFLVALAFTFYAEALYPNLPQSLGGGKPRCAQLDLDAATLSGATLADLAPGAEAEGIVRTPELDVVFTQGDTLFVLLVDERVVEVRGGSIRAVAGCG